MKQKVKLKLFGCCFVAIIPLFCLCQTPIDDPSWGNVLWGDEFSSIDFSKWHELGEGVSPSNPWGWGDWHNDAICSCDPNICDCTDPNDAGCPRAYRTQDSDNMYIYQDYGGTEGIRLRVLEEDITHTGCNPDIDLDYTAPVWLLSKKAFRYGYFEMRCRLPDLYFIRTNSGIGANFWLMSINATDGSYSEIDIFEFICHDQQDHNTFIPNNYTSNIWYEPPTGGGRIPDPIAHQKDKTEDFNGQYHKFGAAWFPDRIEFYHNDQLTHISQYHPGDLRRQNIIIDLNVFTYGEWIDRWGMTILPYDFDVDYVRVYQADK